MNSVKKSSRRGTWHFDYANGNARKSDTNSTARCSNVSVNSYPAHLMTSMNGSSGAQSWTVSPFVQYSTNCSSTSGAITALNLTLLRISESRSCRTRLPTTTVFSKSDEARMNHPLHWVDFCRAWPDQRSNEEIRRGASTFSRRRRRGYSRKSRDGEFASGARNQSTCSWRFYHGGGR